MISILIVILGVIGVLLCLKIYKKKRSPKPLVCMLGADCNTVLKSDFSSFFGIGLEIYGLMYYGLSALLYLSTIIFPILQNPIIYFILFGLSFSAFLFSVYLISIQALVIKSWCSWCIISASISTLIFIFSIIGVIVADISFIPILEALKNPLVVLHLLGFALGVGGATMSDIIFFKFLKDYKISGNEDSTLKVLSQVIWFGLMILVISGFGLYLPEASVLNESSKFLLKVTVVAIIAINGVFLNLAIAPHLVKISFKDSVTKTTPINNLRKFAFAAGAISFVSWYTAFILGTIKSLPFSFIELLLMYGGVLFFAIIVSLYVEKKYCTQTISTNKIEKKIINS